MKPLTREEIEEHGVMTGDNERVLALVARAEKAEREVACFRAARVKWPDHVLEAVARGDVEACAADAKARHANWTRMEQENAAVAAFTREAFAVRDDLQARLNGEAQRANAATRERDEARANLTAFSEHCDDVHTTDGHALLQLRAELTQAIAQRDAADERLSACAAEGVALRETLHRIATATERARTGIHGEPKGETWSAFAERLQREAAAALDAPSASAEVLAAVKAEAFKTRDEAWRLMLSLGGENEPAIVERDERVRNAALDDVLDHVHCIRDGYEHHVCNCSCAAVRALAKPPSEAKTTCATCHDRPLVNGEPCHACGRGPLQPACEQR